MLGTYTTARAFAAAAPDLVSAAGTAPDLVSAARATPGVGFSRRGSARSCLSQGAAPGFVSAAGTAPDFVSANGAAPGFVSATGAAPDFGLSCGPSSSSSGGGAGVSGATLRDGRGQHHHSQRAQGAHHGGDGQEVLVSRWVARCVSLEPTHITMCVGQGCSASWSPRPRLHPAVGQEAQP